MEQGKPNGDGGQSRPWPGTRALTHPVTLMAISLLLVNDHVLKQVVPSVLTGKLGAFAGLFIFPMLALALLGSVLGHRGHKLAAGAAYALTGGAFAILKLIGRVHAAVRELAEQLVGMPLQLALDATDVRALVVLPVGYVVWLRAESRPARLPPRAGLLALSAGTLAALATAPCPPEQPIARLLTDPEGVYAVARSWDPFSAFNRSRDAGRNWEFLQEADVPMPIAEAASQSAAYPIVGCLAAVPRSCFHIDGTRTVVEESQDGGQSWETAWAPPAARLSSMQRVAAGSGEILACGKEIDLTPHDLILLEEGGQTTVLVALGNEGVLRGPAEGEAWERLAVGWAEPTPERASGLQDLWLPSPILTETLVVLAGAGIAFLVLSVRGWRLTPLRPDASGEGYRAFWRAAAILCGAAALGLLALGGVQLLLIVGIPLALLLGYCAFVGERWSIAIADSTLPPATRRALWVSLLGTFGCAVLAWLALALWMFGAIPAYPLALLAAAVAVVAGWVWGWMETGRAISSEPIAA